MTGPMPPDWDYIDPKLPTGVLASRMDAILKERKVTAQVIADLETTSIDIVNQLIRVRTILKESLSLTRPAMVSHIKEALDVIS